MLKSYFYSLASTWMSGLCEPEYKQIKTKYEVIQNTCAYRAMARNAASSTTFKYKGKHFPHRGNLSRKVHRNINYSNLSINCHRQIYSIQHEKTSNPLFLSSLQETERIYQEADYFLLSINYSFTIILTI